MNIIDLKNNERGQLFYNKSPLSSGLFMHIQNSTCNKLSLQTKQIIFTNLSFNKSGDRFLACDKQGSIYLFDLSFNRYTRVNRLGSACTCLAYNLKCKTEYLVACIDGTIKCFNTETKDLVGWMKGHDKPILGLSVHPTNGDMVISYTNDLAQLWDLKNFECKEKLNISSKNNVEIIKISFAPYTNDIVSLFKDDSIFVWSSDKIFLKCQFNVNDNEKSLNQNLKHFYKCFSISSDGKILVTGSRNNYLHVWNIHGKKFDKKIDLKYDQSNSKNLKDCYFLPGKCYENKIVIVLNLEGSLDLYNIESGDFLASLIDKNINPNQIGFLKEQKISQIYCTQNSHYLCTITHNGFIQCYDCDLSIINNMKSSANIKRSVDDMSTYVKNNASEDFNQEFFNKNVRKSQNEKNLDTQIEKKLYKILKCFHEYPSRYRIFIWKTILKLPENYETYALYVKKGTHPRFTEIAKRYPLKSQKSIRLLQTTLSALSYWSEILAECEYLPMLVFPFVKLFKNNQIVCFEIIATLIINWCQHWFEFFPNPPMNILNIIENLLAYHDKILLDHFIKHRITCVIYGWSLLETLFSEVFNKNDWQILFDNIFSNHPGFLLYIVASYSVYNRDTLLTIKDIDDAKIFFQNQHSVNVNKLIFEASRLAKSTPKELDPCKLLNDFKPMTKGSYPILNRKPNFINDYHLNEKSKILEQEINYLNEREKHIESHKISESKKLNNEYYYKQLYKNENECNQFNSLNSNLKDQPFNFEKPTEDKTSIMNEINKINESIYSVNMERDRESIDEKEKLFMNQVNKLRKNIALRNKMINN